MLFKLSRRIGIAIVDVIEIIVSSSDQRRRPSHSDGVISSPVFPNC